MTDQQEDVIQADGGEVAQAGQICVAVRCRPMSEKEQAGGDRGALQLPKELAEPGVPSQLVLSHKGEDLSYTFDHVFGPETSQEQVFTTLGLQQLDTAFDGYNSTIFAYGQTGSGKTHTMMGDGSERGLIPRIGEGLFARAAELAKDNGQRRCLVQCSFLEIYNEVIYDLLAPRTKGGQRSGGLEVREQKGLGVYVKDLTETVVEDPERLAKLIEDGLEHRATSATKMNDASSRSHCVFTIRLHQKDASNSLNNTISKLNLVDLAGSERARATDAEGVRLKEGANINKSLSALGNVINALSAMAEGKKRAFVPYRDSKLTRVLQESLGGNAFCTMVANICPASSMVEETLSTLNYARRAKAIRVAARKNEESLQVRLMEQEAEALRQKLSQDGQRASSQDSEEAHSAELAQLAALQGALKQTWEDKQKITQEQEEQRKQHKEEELQLAERLKQERRRRIAALEEQGDLNLTLQSLAAFGSESCVDWPDRISDAVRTGKQLRSQLRAVELYRQSAAGDFSGLWQRCDEIVAGGGDVASALAVVGQVRSKLDAMGGELDALRRQEELLVELIGLAAPMLSIAACEAKEDAIRSAEDADLSNAAELSRQQELVDLLGLTQLQLSRYGEVERAHLQEEVRKLDFGQDLALLRQRLEAALALAGEAAPAAQTLLAELAGVGPACDAQPEPPAVADAGPAGAPQADVLGLASLEFPDGQLSASSNAAAARCARLLRAPCFGGWCPARDAEGEHLELDLGQSAQGRAVVGISLQGRLPCTGRWQQTAELLRLALAGAEDCGQLLRIPDKQFVRPPVRLVHEVAVALVRKRGCFGAGEGAWQIPANLTEIGGMSKEEKLEFFNELISRTSQAWEGRLQDEALRVTSQDILGGKQCEETNRLLQLLLYLGLGLGGELGGLSDACPQWTTSWKLQYLAEPGGWRWLGGETAAEALELEGNSDARGVKFVSLPEPCAAQRLRICPVSWHRHAALRCEVHFSSGGAASLLGATEEAPVALLGGAAAARSSASRPTIRLRAGVELANRGVLQLQQFLEVQREAHRNRETSLKEQAEQEKGELEQRLRDALDSVAALTKSSASTQAELLQARVENERLGEVVTQLRQDVKSVSKARAASEARLVEMERESATLHATIEEFTDQLLVVTDERDVARQKEEELFDEIEAKEMELNQLTRELNNMRQRLHDKEVEGEATDLLTEEMVELTDRLQEVQTAHGQAVGRCQELELQVKTLRKETSALTAERDKLAAKKKKLEEKKEALAARLEMSEQARRAARERCERMLEQRKGGVSADFMAALGGTPGSARKSKRMMGSPSPGSESYRSEGTFDEYDEDASYMTGRSGAGSRPGSRAGSPHSQGSSIPGPLARGGSPTFGAGSPGLPDLGYSPAQGRLSGSRPSSGRPLSAAQSRSQSHKALDAAVSPEGRYDRRGAGGPQLSQAGQDIAEFWANAGLQPEHALEHDASAPQLRQKSRHKVAH